MSPQELVKNFLLSWARRSVDLNGALAAAKNELTKEPPAMQELQWIEQNQLSSVDRRRELAFQLALAEYQVNYGEF